MVFVTSSRLLCQKNRLLHEVAQRPHKVLQSLSIGFKHEKTQLRYHVYFTSKLAYLQSANFLKKGVKEIPRSSE